MKTEKWRHFRTSLLEQFPFLNHENETYRWLVLASVMVGTFMAVLDSTIVNVALSKLMATFGVSVDRIEWIVTAYLLIFAVTLPSSSWLADAWGYKPTFLLGLFLFTFGSFLSSLSWSIGTLIVFRVVQGAGAGLLLPVGMAILTREFPPEKRGIALGFWSVAASASVALGPTAGGYLIERFSWHAIFDINIPIGIMGMAASLIILRNYKSPHVRYFDVIGFLSLTAFLTCLLLALSSGNSAWNTGGWTSTYILTNIAISLVGLVIFLITEFSIQHPLIDLRIFKDLNFTISNMVFFIFGLGVFGSTFLLPIYLQNSLRYTPLQAGLVFFPMGILVGLTAPLAGIFSDRFDGRIPAVAGLALMALSLYQYNFLSYLSEKSQIMFPLYLRGIGMGLIMSPLATMAISKVGHEKMAQASGLINVIRQIGGSFGVALFGTLITRRTIFHSAIYGQQLSAYSDSFKQTVLKLQRFAVHTSGGSSSDGLSKAQATIFTFVQNQAFIKAVDDVFLIASIVVLASLVPALFLRTYKGRRRAKPVDTEKSTVEI
ncbi:MAG: DHA2 family efflux MFS transporter permease subunit [Candidatus Zixiibacteriota bacterium]